MPNEQHPDLLVLAEKAWRGELDLQFEHHPVHRYYPGSCLIAEGLLGFKGIAGFYVIDSGDGLVMLDAGHLLDVKRCYEDVRRWRPDTPVSAAIYSHHHADHVFSVTAFDAEAEERGWPRPTVYAHERVPAHFDRYRAMVGWNTAINRRQFAIDAPHYRWPDSYRYPDVVYRRSMTFRRGELNFELTEGRGETDDVTWTFIPERRILHTGDLFIWAVPNAGNPQKVQRYVGDWADSLERMLPLGAEILLPGHGLPIIGADRVRQALAGTARYMRSIEEQSVAAMNRGLSLDRVVQAVQPPEELADEPYLQPFYDDPTFLVRMDLAPLWRLVGRRVRQRDAGCEEGTGASLGRAGRWRRPGGRAGAQVVRGRAPCGGVPPDRGGSVRGARECRGPRGACGRLPRECLLPAVVDGEEHPESCGPGQRQWPPRSGFERVTVCVPNRRRTGW